LIRWPHLGKVCRRVVAPHTRACGSVFRLRTLCRKHSSLPKLCKRRRWDRASLCRGSSRKNLLRIVFLHFWERGSCIVFRVFSSRLHMTPSKRRIRTIRPSHRQQRIRPLLVQRRKRRWSRWKCVGTREEISPFPCRRRR